MPGLAAPCVSPDVKNGLFNRIRIYRKVVSCREVLIKIIEDESDCNRAEICTVFICEKKLL